MNKDKKDEILDGAFDITVYTLISLCFIVAGIFIIKSLTYESYLWHSAGLIGMGIGLSIFLIYIKSWSEK